MTRLEHTQTSHSGRADAWTLDDDETLTNTVLSTIRYGGTQLSAFEVAAQQLKRTSAACGFRWNGVLRHRCKVEIEQAKREKKMRISGSHQPESMTSSLAMQEVIHFLESLERNYQALRGQTVSLTEECERLREKIQQLEQSLAKNTATQPASPQQLQEDVKRLAEIAVRARKLLNGP
ncbi:RsfA family transcriptional regulator [Alicyclobacillus tolerans]|uniref:RsfA family transcriptional regulator n=1 Tax=Alicyclobacillus tolerans TaxID=90970 RepID=UPI0027DF8D87|nr:RsfA family transcriptional regulator [Alicyclobacillus tolerans]MCF8568232.1 RsfA family transcriptional regulator [Alicyclobacillus tolerans]